MRYSTQRRNARSRLRFEALEDRRLLANVPAGFTETVLAANLTSPTTLDIEESGRIWVAYQDGRIEVIEEGTQGTSFAYQLDADGSAEHGLQGLELDPDFENNGYLYVYYTANSPEPHNRLSRLTVDPTTENTILAGSEVPLLELPNLSDYGNPPWHIGGAVHFGLDGTIFVQIGESQQAVQSQDLESPLGKIFRINSDGSIPTDNPYYDAGDGLTWKDHIWASGLRNPFAGDLDPVTGRYLVADVGQGSWEELNDATAPGLNFGWPTTEGPFDTEQFPDFTEPLYAYSHAQGCAITGGVFYNGGTNPYPAEYQGHFFFSEFCGGDIRVIDPNNPGGSNSAEVFATDAAFPMNIEVAPDGSLVYISRGAGAGGAPGIGTGTVRKISYAADVAPSIIIDPTDQLASVGYDAEFFVSAAGTTPLAYQWQISTGSGFADIPGENSPTLLLENVQLSATGNQYRAVVTNTLGSVTSGAATLAVTNDTPPTPIITLPSAGMTYRAGDLITFSGGASDLEDGSLSAADLTWRVDFHHNVHSHPFIAPTSGITGGEFTIPTATETDDDVWYRINLTATDSAGLSTSTFFDLFPEKSTFSIVTNVGDGGGNLLVDGKAEQGPFVDTGVENVQRTITVDDVQDSTNGPAYFSQWLDGVTTTNRTLFTPTNDTAYVALYESFSGDVTYVSDLTPSAPPLNGWGPIEIDTSNGEEFPGDGETITLNGVEYAKGLGVHADSVVTFDINGQYTRFMSDIGVDDETGNGGSVVFHVLADGNEIYTSGVLTGASPSETVNIDISGVDELVLEVTNGGDGNGLDHADWADARLVAGAIESALLPFAASDINLDTRLDLADVVAFGAGWGADGTGFSLEERVRHGDLDFDGDTDVDDWDIFNARWLAENNAPISLDAVLNPIPGDYNRNGFVSSADYNTWSRTYGSSLNLAADGNGDSLVNSIDYAIWRESLGNTSGSSIFLDNLALFIDPATGEGTLRNDTNGDIDLVGYSILSEGYALLPGDANWSSLTDQSLPGWQEASPSPTALNELNAQSSLSLSPGDAVSLGGLFDTAFPQTGISLEFAVAGSFEPQAGVAVFSEILPLASSMTFAPALSVPLVSEAASTSLADSQLATTNLTNEELSTKAISTWSSKQDWQTEAPDGRATIARAYTSFPRQDRTFDNTLLILASDAIRSHYSASLPATHHSESIDSAINQLFGDREHEQSEWKSLEDWFDELGAMT